MDHVQEDLPVIIGLLRDGTEIRYRIPLQAQKEVEDWLWHLDCVVDVIRKRK